jgi:phospholipid-binding lipoprotein MlaA
MFHRRSPLILSVLLVIGCAVSGCAAPGATDAGFNDPLEDTNRAIFRFNQGVDETVLVPVAKTYRTVLPPPVRQSVHDFLQNLGEPVVFAHDVLQGQLGLAANTVGRFAINTTLGVGGLFDPATQIGLPYHTNDLGITLATWGFPEGPYIMVPVLGPSNPRDLIGQVGDSYADPGNRVASAYHFMWASFARAAASGIDERSRNIENLADIERTSLDYYATIRSLYRQRRAAQIRHEPENLPNPSPIQGTNSPPGPAISYTTAKPN